MQIWGLHLLDVLIVLAYMVGMLIIGQYLAKTIKGQNDFYLAGRKLGKALQFFLNFGAMTDAGGAMVNASEVYRQGVGGAWLSFQSVFYTPFFWFAKVWWRRARVVTLGDLFADRFNSKAFGALYAAYAVFLSMLIIGFVNLTAYKTMTALVVKSPTKYTAEEKQMVADFGTYQQLKGRYSQGKLSVQEKQQYEMLRDISNKGQLHGFVSYLQHPLPFYIIYSLVVGVYMVLGGFMAAVITDVFQGLLIIVFSAIMIPFGLARLGGLSELQASVPEHMLRIFGTASTSEYTWYSILAILFTSLIGYFSSAHDMTISASAKDEFASRFGGITGAFAKRLITVAWIFCALIAIGLFGGQISDPDMTWGVLSRSLLGPGFLGLMLAGILAANMSSIDAQIISSSALFVRNIYSILVLNKSEQHYVLVGRLTAVIGLAVGIFIAMTSTGMIPLLKVLLTLPAIFGSAVLLAIFWRRLTKTAVMIQVPLLLTVTGILPFVLPAIGNFRQLPQLVIQTQEQEITVVATATQADVTAGLAAKAGEMINKKHVIAPASVFFESVTHVDPADADSPLEGVGRFSTEIYIASLLGVPVQSFTKAGLVATRFGFCVVTPFVLLFVLSYLTKPTDKSTLDRFYVRMKTPTATTLELDAIEMEKSYANPQRFDHCKLFPNSNWEFCKWTRQDTIGFLFCWIATGFVFFCFWWTVHIIS